MLSLEVNSLIWKLRKWTQRGCDLAMELECNGDSKNTEIHVSETSLSAPKSEYIPHCFNNSFVVPETPPLVRRGSRQWFSNTNYQEIVQISTLWGGFAQVVSLFFWCSKRSFFDTTMDLLAEVISIVLIWQNKCYQPISVYQSKTSQIQGMLG